MTSMADTTELLRSIGEQLRQLRIAEGLSQEELAARANVGVATLRRLETGHDISLGRLIPLIKTLGRADWFAELDPIGDGPTPMELVREREGRERRPRRVSRSRS